MESTSLSSEEEKILDIIKNFLKKEPFFYISGLIDFINRRLDNKLGYTLQKIEETIKSLIRKKFIIPGSKLVKEDILDLPIRDDLFEYITQNPGTHLNEIMEAQDMGSNQALWHLKVLEKFKFIKSEEFENQIAYFKSDIKPDLYQECFYLRNEKVQQIIDLLEGNDGTIGPTNISKELDIHYNTAKKYLNKLNDLNIINEFTKNDKKTYSLNSEVHQELLKKIEELK